MKINKKAWAYMEVTAVTSKETNNKEEEYKKISTNKRKKLKYYKIIVYNLQPTIPSGNKINFYF